MRDDLVLVGRIFVVMALALCAAATLGVAVRVFVAASGLGG